MIHLVAGARPNFMKIAPLVWEFKRRGFHDYSVIHTGQHYDYEMSMAFFDDLELDEPDYYLEVGSGTHSYQTAEVMKSFEGVCLKERPEMIVVVGDVNSTMACALTGAKLQIPVCHIEAGLRSFDRSMPEETNRVVTDHISDILFVTEEAGVKNLAREGLNNRSIHLVGNIMIDSLKKILPLSDSTETPDGDYIIATIHRPSNVDDRRDLLEIADILKGASNYVPVIFFAHPRTRKNLEEFALIERFTEIDTPPKSPERGEVYITNPLGYVEFIGFVKDSAAVITDSGGIQSETTYLKIPCLTLRENSEMPITIESGTNTLVGRDANLIKEGLQRITDGSYKKGKIPELWDGRTSDRIADILLAG